LFEWILEFFKSLLGGFGVVGDVLLFVADNFLWLVAGFVAFLFFERWIKRRRGGDMTR